MGILGPTGNFFFFFFFFFFFYYNLSLKKKSKKILWLPDWPKFWPPTGQEMTGIETASSVVSLKFTLKNDFTDFFHRKCAAFGLIVL